MQTRASVSSSRDPGQKAGRDCGENAGVCVCVYVCMCAVCVACVVCACVCVCVCGCEWVGGGSDRTVGMAS